MSIMYGHMGERANSSTKYQQLQNVSLSKINTNPIHIDNAKSTPARRAPIPSPVLNFREAVVADPHRILVTGDPVIERRFGIELAPAKR